MQNVGLGFQFCFKTSGVEEKWEHQAKGNYLKKAGTVAKDMVPISHYKIWTISLLIL